jgi:hypothetical protein
VFLTLMAVRSVDVRFAIWDQIDLAQRVWTVPAIKTGKQHRVPLFCARSASLSGRQ